MALSDPPEIVCKEAVCKLLGAGNEVVTSGKETVTQR